MKNVLDNQRNPLAYEDEAFMNSAGARSLRVLSEYLKPLNTFRQEKIRDTIVFFGSARVKEDGPLAKYYDEARTLSRMLTEWCETFENPNHRFVVCTGGGPGIMEAANRGANDAKGKTVGLNIRLPFEQHANPYISPELNFEFHYFFMRKFWFAYLAKALIVFPGGFGTMDELFEILTLTQTKKLHKQMITILYGSAFWKEIINFDALIKNGMISEEDMQLFRFVDTPEEGFQVLQDFLTENYLHPRKPLPQREMETPAIAESLK